MHGCVREAGHWVCKQRPSHPLRNLHRGARPTPVTSKMSRKQANEIGGLFSGELRRNAVGGATSPSCSSATIRRGTCQPVNNSYPEQPLAWPAPSCAGEIRTRRIAFYVGWRRRHGAIRRYGRWAGGCWMEET